MDNKSFVAIIEEYRNDPESVYHTWFINNLERLKAFRTIKNGLYDVIDQIEKRTFGNDFKGSSLENAITAISEQKQVFEGAAHPFFWKPKLRIPDIYENESNQLAFGRFLKTCSMATNEKQIVQEILKIDNLQIKGLGPAVANILYFLHPTLFPPFNTAIVNGFNALYSKKIKLGSWSAYLTMREQIMLMNQQYRTYFSKDLGAVAGLLFEIGNGRIVIENNSTDVLKIEEKKRNTILNKRHKQVIEDIEEENSHTEMQYHLARLGVSLGYKVWIAQNDHNREWNEKKLGEYSITNLPLRGIPQSESETISFIDVIWLNKESKIIAAFEVEKSTSIYSGILRLHDLSLSIDSKTCKLFLVAPNKREKEIKAQLLRPAFRDQIQLQNSMSYILFSDLQCDCDAMCKFGTDINVLDKIAKKVTTYL